MRRTVRSLLTAAALIAVAVSLSGCDFLKPTRDTDGRVVAPLDARASQLRVGDCFSFQDAENLSRVTIVPCADDHGHLVISQGQLSPARIKLSGGLQNALSVICTKPYEDYVATLAEGEQRDQEFLVSMVEKDGYDYANYSCVVAVETLTG